MPEQRQQSLKLAAALSLWGLLHASAVVDKLDGCFISRPYAAMHLLRLLPQSGSERSSPTRAACAFVRRWQALALHLTWSPDAKGGENVEAANGAPLGSFGFSFCAGGKVQRCLGRLHFLPGLPHRFPQQPGSVQGQDAPGCEVFLVLPLRPTTDTGRAPPRFMRSVQTFTIACRSSLPFAPRSLLAARVFNHRPGRQHGP